MSAPRSGWSKVKGQFYWHHHERHGNGPYVSTCGKQYLPRCKLFITDIEGQLVRLPQDCPACWRALSGSGPLPPLKSES